MEIKPIYIWEICDGIRYTEKENEKKIKEWRWVWHELVITLRPFKENIYEESNF